MNRDSAAIVALSVALLGCNKVGKDNSGALLFSLLGGGPSSSESKTTTPEKGELEGSSTFTVVSLDSATPTTSSSPTTTTTSSETTVTNSSNQIVAQAQSQNVPPTVVAVAAASQATQQSQLAQSLANQALSETDSATAASLSLQAQQAAQQSSTASQVAQAASNQAQAVAQNPTATSSTSTTSNASTPTNPVPALAIDPTSDATAAAAQTAAIAKAQAEAEALAKAQAEAKALADAQAAAAAKAAADAKAAQEAQAAAEALAKAQAEAKALADAQAAAAAKAAQEAQAAADAAAAAAAQAALLAAAQTQVQTQAQQVVIPPPKQFTLETNVTVPITVNVVDSSGPVVKAPVTVSETITTPSIPNVLGTGVTNNQGTAVIPISVVPAVTNVNIAVVGTNPITGETKILQGTAPIQVPTSTSTSTSTSTAASTSTATSTSVTTVAPVLNLNTQNFQSITGCAEAIDRDCDGIADIYDEFPDNKDLATTVRSGRYTISFEDLYPSAGDADLNDHVTVFQTEMDRTPDNKVKTIRGIFTHIGKGAGYNHELRVRFDVPTGANFKVNYTNQYTGKPWTGCAAAPKYVTGTQGDCVGGKINSAGLRTGLLLLPSSNTTLFNSSGSAVQNAPRKDATFSKTNFAKGVTSFVEITFDTPVDLAATKNIVGGHLNYFLAINQKDSSTSPFRQIFRPGYYFDSTGKDLFMDSKNFPWAVIVPGLFNYPRESQNISVASSTGYLGFISWQTSKGQTDREWFKNITNPSLVVLVKDFYEPTSFTAYLFKAVKEHQVAVSLTLILIGASMGFFLKHKGKLA